MPLTFPSHAAAVWPLHRAAPRLLPATALIVGSCTPDLAYLFDLGISGHLSHSLTGTIVFSLPIGLITLGWIDFIAPTLRRALPRPMGLRLVDCFSVPAFPRSSGQAARTLLAVWVGALTHLLWDGFTHRTRWPASILYPSTYLALPFGNVHLANLLQHLSTVIGLVVVGFWLRDQRRTDAADASHAEQTRHHRPTALLLLASGVVGATLTVLLASSAVWHPWRFFWTSMRGGLLGGTLACLIVRLKSRAG